MKTLSCKEVGVNCSFTARGNTNEEVLNKLAEHGKKVHGMKDADFTAEKTKQFSKLVHEENEQRV